MVSPISMFYILKAGNQVGIHRSFYLYLKIQEQLYLEVLQQYQDTTLFTKYEEKKPFLYVYLKPLQDSITKGYYPSWALQTSTWPNLTQIVYQIFFIKYILSLWIHIKENNNT